MIRMAINRPTTYYDEGVKHIDENICELIMKRKGSSSNNPGVPSFELIASWADKFKLNEELLKSLFISLWNEDKYKQIVNPEGFKRNILVVKSTQVENRIFSVVTIRQYSNSSIVDLNIDNLMWEMECEITERKPHTQFELFINENYNCIMLNGTGGNGHFHYNFIVSPALPDDLSGIELIFKEKEFSKDFEEKQVCQDITICL